MRFMTQTLTKPVLEYCEELVRYLQDDYDSESYDPGGRYKFTISTGRKYYKILENKGSVHAFVDKTTGDVFKPASWNKPAQHVRYNLLDNRSRSLCFDNSDWSGGYLYLRG